LNLNIRQLERLSGLPRTTIYYYVRTGLLPVGKKTGASRAQYSDDHVALLQEIARLKSEGLGLEEIKAQVSSRVETLSAANLDASASHAEQVRRSILNAAARRFPQHGYRGTRIGDIIDEVGITWATFYGHFASKEDLFVEAFPICVDWMQRSLETQTPRDRDPLVRELARVQSLYFGLRSVGSDLLSLVRGQAERGTGDMRTIAQDTLKRIIRDTRDDLTRLRDGKELPSSLSDELVAFGLFGASQAIIMRAGWDDDYRVEDVLAAAYLINYAIQAAYRAQLPVAADWVEYADTISALADEGPRLPLEHILNEPESGD
jgi:AcrR family transcriptional regulator